MGLRDMPRDYIAPRAEFIVAGILGIGYGMGEELHFDSSAMQGRGQEFP